MKLLPHRKCAFSLVEVTLALGVAAFCLIAVLVCSSSEFKPISAQLRKLLPDPSWQT